MRRVVVIGSGGSGKSTFSRDLGQVTGLPVVHLDRLYWKPGWVEPDKAEWMAIVKREISKPDWIMDGNYGGSREIRMAAADTIIFLDLPRWLCMFRILKRRIAYLEGPRPDMAEGCPEKIDLEFITWVWTYKHRSRGQVFDELAALKDKRVIILRTPRDVSSFLDDPYAYQTR